MCRSNIILPTLDSIKKVGYLSSQAVLYQLMPIINSQSIQRHPKSIPEPYCVLNITDDFMTKENAPLRKLKTEKVEK